MGNRPLVASCAFVVVLIGGGFSTTANAWDTDKLQCPASDYAISFDGCYHRFPNAVLKGCKERHNECPGVKKSAPPVAYITATPSQVNAAIQCDIAAAAKQTKGKPVDFSTAVIKGALTFSEVKKSSAGVSLSVPAISVFLNASVAPSLSASSLTSTTRSTITNFGVAPAELSLCDYSSNNQWLTSQAIMNPVKGQTISTVTEAVSFVVTRQGSAGLKLNIIPISIGPQFSGEEDNTHQICLLFDFTKNPDPKEKASCPGGADK